MTDFTGGRIELGEGAREALAFDGRGQVVAVYRRAAYVRLPAGLVALTTDDVWRGPLYTRSLVRPDRLAPGDRVDVVGGCELRVGATSVDLSTARVWRGPLPDPARLTAALALAAADDRGAGFADLFAGAPPTALAGPLFADCLGVALRRLDHGDLAGVARAIGGLGPGLTPAGDDTLAGILLVSRVLAGDAAEDGLVAVADGVRTTSVARAFLHWAARGQSVEPVHDLLAALAAGDGPAAAVHLAVLGELGHSSGADLAYGLHLGLATGLGPGSGVEVARVSPA